MNEKGLDTCNSRATLLDGIQKLDAHSIKGLEIRRLCVGVECVRAWVAGALSRARLARLSLSRVLKGLRGLTVACCNGTLSLCVACLRQRVPVRVLLCGPVFGRSGGLGVGCV